LVETIFFVSASRQLRHVSEAGLCDVERFAENIAGALTNDTTVGRSPKTQLLRIPLTSDIIRCILQAAILGCVKDDPFGPQDRVLGFSPLQHGE
jgi:hypothetical protein